MSVKVKTVFGVLALQLCIQRGEVANSGQIHKFNLLSAHPNLKGFQNLAWLGAVYYNVAQILQFFQNVFKCSLDTVPYTTMLQNIFTMFAKYFFWMFTWLGAVHYNVAKYFYNVCKLFFKRFTWLSAVHFNVGKYFYSVCSKSNTTSKGVCNIHGN